MEDIQRVDLLIFGDRGRAKVVGDYAKSLSASKII